MVGLTIWKYGDMSKSRGAKRLWWRMGRISARACSPLRVACEHHVAPIIGRAHIGYVPDGRVVGISKLARVVNTFTKRLQIQERMTAQIAQAIDRVLKPRGVGVVIEATHACCGVHSRGASMVTSHMLGVFRDSPAKREEFLSAFSLRSGAHELSPSASC